MLRRLLCAIGLHAWVYRELGTRRSCLRCAKSQHWLSDPDAFYLYDGSTWKNDAS